MHNQSGLNNRSIRFRLVALFLLSVIIAVIALSASIIYSSYRGGSDQTLDRLDSIATLKLASLEDWESRLRLALVGVSQESNIRQVAREVLDARSDTVDEAVASQVRQQLQNRLETTQLFDELMLVDASGQVVVSTTAASEGSTFSELTNLENEASFSGLLFEPQTVVAVGERSDVSPILISRPILTASGISLGILAARADMQIVDALMLERVGLGDTGETYLIAGNQFPITPLIDPSVSVIEAGQAFTVANTQASMRGSSTNYIGEDVLGVYLYMPDLELVLAAEQGRAEALDLVFVQIRQIAISTILIAIPAIAISLLLARSIGNPLANLTNTALEITSGNLDSYAQVNSRDEFGILARAFNDMTRRLRERIAEVQDLLATVEKRVQDRTHDLQISSEIARQIASILEQDALLDEIVQRTVEAFELYQASIFVYSPVNHTLELVASAGAGDRAMLERRLNRQSSRAGLVSNAAHNRSTAVVNDVSASEDYAANDLLPNTKSEAAFAIVYADKLLGVLDLHSETVNRFKESDVQLFTTFANQIAVALNNATVFEELERAKIRAERADEVKSAFLASTSHELRTPLNAIINLTSFVHRGTTGPVNDRQVELLGFVLDSAHSLLSLINDVLDMSKIESGCLTLYLTDDVDLQKIFDNVLMTARSLIQNEQVTLSSQVPDQLPLVRVDEQRMKQILLNLLSNACKFTDEGEIVLRAAATDSHIEIAVSDTGAGIHADDLDKVFKQFAQTESGLKSGSGSGLGMPITKSLVEAHGGTIHIESTVDVGTTVSFKLPYSITEIEKQPTPEAQ